MISSKSSPIFFQTLISSLLGYISLFFIIRYVGPIYWGYLSYALAFGGLFSLITDMGFNTAYMKSISGEGNKADDMGTYLFIKIVLNIVYIAVILISLWFWIDVLKRGFQNPIEFWTIITIIPYFVIANFIPLFNNYYRSEMQSYKISMSRLIEAVLRNSILIVISILYYLHMEGNIGSGVVVIFSLLYTISYGIYITILWHYGRPWYMTKPTVKNIRKYITIALPLAFATSIGIVNGNVDKVIVQYFWGAIATGALYTDQRLISIFTVFTTPVTIFILPMLMKNLKETKEMQGQKIIQYERILSLAIMPFMLIFVILSPFILNLYNEAYLDYATSLSIVAIGGYISTLSMPFADGLISKGRQNLIGSISIIAITLNILLNLILIPSNIYGIKMLSLGVAGATISYTIASLLTYILYKHYYNKYNETRIKSVTLKHIVVALPTTTFLLYFAIFIKPYAFIYLFPVVLVALLIYTGMSISMKEVSIEQIKDIIKNIIPKKGF
jgi:O-antigen/teichoic acid export membrane protein